MHTRPTKALLGQEHSQKQADTDERAREKKYKYYIEIYIPHLTACKVDFGEQAPI